MVKSQEKKPSFFKVMIGNFASSLRIPPSFSKHLRESLEVKSVLRDPGGRKWSAKICRDADGCWSLQNGWEDFVRDLAIVHGDFLVFYYDGDFVFDVKVYGNTGCEKFAEDIEKKEATLEKKKKKSKKAEKEHIYIGKTSSGFIPLNRPLNEIEKQKAFTDACTFKPAHPHFVTAWTTYRTHRLTIPHALAEEFEVVKKKFVILRDPKWRTWQVKVHCRVDGRADFYTGWSAFVKGNSLGEGDACCFEFIQGGALIHVHIFRGQGVKKENSEPARKSDNPIVQSIETHLPRFNRGSVLHAARSFKSEHSSFVYTWKSNRNVCVAIPRMLVKKFGLARQKKLLLYDPRERQWIVQIRTRLNGNTEFGIGWYKFIRSNNIMKTDVCIFEFLDAGAIKVHIFRANEANGSTPASEIISFD